MAEGEVFIRVKEGRIHRAVLQDGDLLTREICNVDDAKERTLIDEETAARFMDDWCQHCFPEAKEESDGS